MSRNQDNWRVEGMPRWKRIRAVGNPPPKQRRLWRQEYRASENRRLREHPEDFQDFPANKVTSLYDWY